MSVVTAIFKFSRDLKVMFNVQGILFVYASVTKPGWQYNLTIKGLNSFSNPMDFLKKLVTNYQ